MIAPWEWYLEQAIKLPPRLKSLTTITMTTTELIPFLKDYLEGRETLDKDQVEFLKKTLKEVSATTTPPYNGIRQPFISDVNPILPQITKRYSLTNTQVGTQTGPREWGTTQSDR